MIRREHITGLHSLNVAAAFVVNDLAEKTVIYIPVQ